MDNQLPSGNLSVSNIAALSNVKEVISAKKNTMSVFILIIMVVFTCLLVFLSVYKFGTTIQSQSKTVHNTASYNNQVQQLTK
jgi:hypothetical protein